jgi:plastocyanin
MRSFPPIVLILLALSAIPAKAAPTGAVSGQIPLPARPRGRIAVEKYTGTISGKVDPPPAPRAGVWVEGAGTAAGSSPPRVVLNQKGYQFAQSLLVVPLHTTVEFPNDDPDFHNVFSLSRTKRFDAGRYKKSERPAPTATFDKAGLVRLQCEIHDHMKAVILVVDSRHFTTTDAAGKFTLSGLPPGTYTLHAQFDEKAKWSTTVTISGGKTATADFARNTTVP